MSEFVFSIDFELAVGIEHFVARSKPPVLQEREVIPKILELAGKHEIPLTFAILGHLFLKSCKGHKIPEEPKVPWYPKPWFEKDPKSSWKKNPEWYAPDLVEKILAEGLHEIACHSFSHIPFSHCSEKVADFELRESLKAMKPLGIKPKTFVFPRNEINHLHLLEKHGFSHYASKPRPKNFLIDFKTFGLGFPKAKRAKGLIEVPRAYFFYTAKFSEFFKLPLLLRLANSQNALFHMWCHGFNASTPSHLKLLEKTFKSVNSLRMEKKTICQVRA